MTDQAEPAREIDRLLQLAAERGRRVLELDEAARTAADEIERLRAEVAELRRTHPRLMAARVRVSPSPFEEDCRT